MSKPWLNRSESAPLVALVEDEEALREELSFQLRHHGWKVVAFADATGLYRHMAVGTVDAVVLDIGLPGENGLAVAQLLRSHDAQLPIVFLTAHAARNEKMAGWQAGGDAYLIKPVDVEELQLVLSRLLNRRSAMALAPHATSPAQGPAVAEATPPKGTERWKLNAERAFLIAPTGIRVNLTLIEMRLLATLHAQRGKPCKPAEVARGLDLMNDEWDRHRLEVMISRLRGKVERETGLPAPIRTVRGVGYAWHADEPGSTP